jgi:hypothetical protein
MLIGVALTTFGGYGLSVYATSSCTTELGFCSVNVRVEIPFGWIGFGSKNFVMIGGTTVFSVALAMPSPVAGFVFGPLSAAETKGVLSLLNGPSVVAVTVTVKLHV